MSSRDPIDFDERRGLESRMSRLEQAMASLDKRMALAERDITQIVSTMQSRYEALHGGQAEILAQLKLFIPGSTIMDWKEELDRVAMRQQALEDIKNQLSGAYVFVRLTGVMGIIGGVIAIVKALKGP